MKGAGRAAFCQPQAQAVQPLLGPLQPLRPVLVPVQVGQMLRVEHARFALTREELHRDHRDRQRLPIEPDVVGKDDAPPGQTVNTSTVNVSVQC